MMFPIHENKYVPDNTIIGVTPEIFREAMGQALQGVDAFGIRIQVIDMVRVAVPNTGGHKNRKKRRIRKKFSKKYGNRIELQRVIKKNMVMDIGGVIYGHAPEINRLRREWERQHPPTNMATLNI